MIKKSFLVTILVVGLLLVVVSAALAAGPIIDKGSYSYVRTYTEMCADFDVVHTGVGTYTDKYFFNDSGVLERMTTHVNGFDVLRNAETGKEVSGKFTVGEKWIYDEDKATVHSTGQDWIITAPGFGHIFKQNGTAKIVFTDAGFQIVHMSASHADAWYDNTGKLCEALGE